MVDAHNNQHNSMFQFCIVSLKFKKTFFETIMFQFSVSIAFDRKIQKVIHSIFYRCNPKSVIHKSKKCFRRSTKEILKILESPSTETCETGKQE